MSWIYILSKVGHAVWTALLSFLFAPYGDPLAPLLGWCVFSVLVEGTQLEAFITKVWAGNRTFRDMEWQTLKRQSAVDIMVYNGFFGISLYALLRSLL